MAAWSGPCGEVDRRVLAVLREQRRSRPVALLSNATDRLPRDLQRLRLTGADGGPRMDACPFPPQPLASHAG